MNQRGIALYHSIKLDIHEKVTTWFIDLNWACFL